MTWRRSWNLRILEGIVRSMKPVQIFMSIQSNWEIILPYCSLGTSRKNERQLLFLLAKEPIDLKTPFAPTEQRGFVMIVERTGEPMKGLKKDCGRLDLPRWIKEEWFLSYETWALCSLMGLRGGKRQIWWNCYIRLLVPRPWKCWKVPVAERGLDAVSSQGIGLKQTTWIQTTFSPAKAQQESYT